MTAEYRSVQTRMWREDDWFQSLPTDARLLFVYLFTNPSASIAGIYRLPLRTIEFESGIPAERISELLAQFSAANKVHYENGVVWVVKMRENQLPGASISPKIRVRLERDITAIPDCPLKTRYLTHYGYPINRVSIPDPKSARETVTVTETVTVPVPETRKNGAAATDGAAAAVDSASASKFTELYKRMWALLPATEYEQAKITDWATRVTVDAWEYALKECVDHRQTGQWKYLETILRRVEREGLPGKSLVSVAATPNGVVSGFDLGQILEE